MNPLRPNIFYSMILFLVTSCLLWSKTPPTVELVTLSPQTWETYAPTGKEVDAIFGDFVLRNDQLVAVIASPVKGRHANMTTLDIGGCIIDLSRRQQSDLLTAYYPVTEQLSLRFAGVDTKAPSVYQVDDLRQLFVQANEISLNLIAIPGNKGGVRPYVTVRYRLSEGWPYVLVETVCSNPTDRPINFRLSDTVRVDYSGDLLTPEFVPDGKIPLFWVYDKWFGQAYGLISENNYLYSKTRGTGRRTPKILTYLPGNKGQTSLHPGETLEIRRRIFPGSNLFDIRAVASEIRKVEQEPVNILVQDRRGAAIGNADILLSRDGVSYAWGRTGLDGVLEFKIPQGTFQVDISALGHGSTSFDLGPLKKTNHIVSLEVSGYAIAEIRDELGNFIPAKLQFRGREGTPDPFFGPDTGEHAVHNVYYTHDGRMRQALPAGSYEVIVSRGPEYDAVFLEITVRRGQDLHLPVTLVRSVHTPGWISSDFHSHSSPSGDNTSSQLGRVLNLLGEHIEFAPCTEHNQISTYNHHLEQLGAQDSMASCSGIELTRGPGTATNHQNAFPMVYKPRMQYGGGPQTSPDPEIQIERLAMWDDFSEKFLQVNHADFGQFFFDSNGDGQSDDGFSRAFGFIDALEVHPPIRIFSPAVYQDSEGRSVNNRMFNWLQLLNQGLRIPGVINTDAHYNFHGSGFWRNYLKISTDEPAEIETMDVVQAAQRGNIMMTNGPYLEVNLKSTQRSSLPQGTAGEDVKAPDGKALLHIRVQCPNWFDIDRIQIYINGVATEALNFTRLRNPDYFSDGTVKFDREINLDLVRDSHVIVVAVGENFELGPVMGPKRESDKPIAVSNPIFVDVDGGGFKPNKDTLGMPLPVKLANALWD